jgi:hypothetical protein
MEHAQETRDEGRDGGDHGSQDTGMYLRFGAMILTAMVVMYWTKRREIDEMDWLVDDIERKPSG